LFVGADSGPVGERIRNPQKAFKGPISENLRLSALKIFKRKSAENIEKSGTSVDPDSEAGRKGLRAGDVIRRVGSQPVSLPSDVSRGIGEGFIALRVAQG